MRQSWAHVLGTAVLVFCLCCVCLVAVTVLGAGGALLVALLLAIHGSAPEVLAGCGVVGTGLLLSLSLEPEGKRLLGRAEWFLPVRGRWTQPFLCVIFLECVAVLLFAVLRG